MDGIYQYDGEVPAEQYAQGIRAGDVKWRDVDDNNLINDNDRQVIGSSNPYFSGGWNNTFRYKGVSLDVFFTLSLIHIYRRRSRYPPDCRSCRS